MAILTKYVGFLVALGYAVWTTKLLFVIFCGETKTVQSLIISFIFMPFSPLSSFLCRFSLQYLFTL